MQNLRNFVNCALKRCNRVKYPLGNSKISNGKFPNPIPNTRPKTVSAHVQSRFWTPPPPHVEGELPSRPNQVETNSTNTQSSNFLVYHSVTSPSVGVVLNHIESDHSRSERAIIQNKRDQKSGPRGQNPPSNGWFQSSLQLPLPVGGRVMAIPQRCLLRH